MTLLAAYATPDEIRAAIGVSEAEINDSKLLLPMYPLHADMDLDDIDLGVRPMFTTIAAKADNLRTTAEERLYQLVRLFATFSIAKVLVGALPMFSVQRMDDGRASFERNAKYLEEARDAVDGTYITLRLRVQNQYNALVPTYVVPVYEDGSTVLLSPLDTDPVTG